MPKYIRTLGLFWSAIMVSEMEYRFNFVLATLSSLGNLTGSIFSLFLFYGRDYKFSESSWLEALIVLGIFTVLQVFSTAFLIPNLNRIVCHLQEGTLDFILLKPLHSQFWLSCHALSPWGLPDIIFGGVVIGYAGEKIGLGLDNYLLSLAQLFCGLVILSSLWFMLGSTRIWFVKIYNITQVLQGLLEAGS